MLEGTEDYLGPEAQARVEIDRQLTACGWVVQRHKLMNLGAGRGVAVREFPMIKSHGDADYLLFVDRKAVGVIEAKKKGSTLTGVEWQSREVHHRTIRRGPLPDEAPSIRLRVDGGRDSLHQRLRPRACEPAGVHFPPSRDPR